MTLALVAVWPRPARLVTIGAARAAYVTTDGTVRALVPRPGRDPVDRAVCIDLVEPAAAVLQGVGVPTDNAEDLGYYLVFPPTGIDPLAYVLCS